jgi:hypothetical protein
MADEVIVVFGAELDGYNAQIKSAIGANDKLEQSANDTSAQITKDFAQSGKAIQQAFGGQQVAKSLDATKKSAAELRAQIKALYDEEVKLLKASKNVANDGVAAVRKEAALLRSALGGLNKEFELTGTELEKNAKKGQTLTAQLKNLKNEINQLDAAGQGGSKAFTDLTIQAAKLEDQIGDTRERVRVLASDTFKFDAAVQGVQAVAGAFAGVQSAIALFGGESEEVNKALLKVQASLGLVAAAQEFANLVTGQGALKLAVLSAAQTLYSSSLGATTTALKIFRGALITTGLGALIVALGFVIAKLQEFAATSAAAAAAVKAANAAQIQSAKDLIKAQLELDVARGKITQAEFDRQTALTTFTTKLSAEILAQKRRVADAELEIESAKQKRLLMLSNPIAGALLVADAEAKKALIIKDGEKTIANLRAEFNAQEQKRILDANKQDKDAALKAAEDKAQAVIKVERTYQEISGQLIIAQSKKRFADVAVLEAQLNVLRNKDSIEAQKELIRAKLKADLLGYELEYQAALKSNEDLEAAKADYLAKIKLAEQQAANDTVALTKDVNKQKLASDEEYTTATISLADRVAAARKTNEEKTLELSTQIANELFNLGSEIGNARIAQLEENAAREVTLAGDDAQKKAGIERKLADEVAKVKRQQAIADKAQALFNIAINTAQAVSKATTTGPGAAAIIPLVIALGAIQAAVVAARPIPKFEKGGYVKGPRHSQGGVIAELEGDEFITNRNATKKNRPLLEAINGGKEKEYIYKRFQVPIIQANQSAAINQKLNAKLDSARMERELQLSRKSERNNTKDIIKAVTNNKSPRYNWN